MGKTEAMDEPVEHLLRDPVKPGRRLGSNYLVGERLGRGAMGVVHEATTNDGRPVAVKFLRAELAADHKTVARFLQERQIFRKVNHPNVVRVHDLVAEGDDLTIVMERVTGGDLKQRIENRSLTPRQSLTIASGIAAGLSAIHEASVVHRDLKPANILLTDDLSPKISDFGISRLVTEAMTRTSATIGTPIYMAPEAADARGADAPADVYALGIMLFELLVGQPPFSQGGTFAVLRAHAMDVPPRVEGVPAQLTDLIAAMLDKDPARRPTVRQVEQSLVALAPLVADDTTPVAVPPIGGPEVESDSVDLTGPEAGDRVSSDQVAPAGAIAAAAWAAADSAETVVSGNVDAGAGAVSTSGETVISHDPVVSGEPMLGSVPAASASPQAQGHGPADDATVINPGLAGAVAGGAVAGGAAAGGVAAFGGLDGGPGSTGDGVPFVASHSNDEARRTGGVGGLFPNRIPRRVIEVVLAFGSLAAVLVVVALVMSGGDDGGSTGIASGDGDGTVPAGPGGNPDGSGNDGQGPTEFTSNIDLGDDDEEGNGTSTTATPTTSGGQADPSSTTSTTDDDGSSTTGSTASTTSTTDSTTTSSTSTTRPTTTLSTTTTRPTTTTSTTTTTTTTTRPTAVPIRIVSGPTLNVVGPTSFQFNYMTNDVCGTGSFRVTNVSTGVSAGSFSGDEVCFGPEHGGYPGLAGNPVFSGFDIEPSTLYRVNITVRGTASDGSKPAGSGTASTSFQVTTAAG